ncbi:MAG: efflux RND transporter periplasmic adaptor subunit [Actinobacteria bacterium]|nr:efflux RND transporter periplasmic adaptor subunit [Actinomycetota bacterium]
MKKRLLLVIVVIVAAVGIGGYFLLRGNSSQQPVFQTVQASIGNVKEVIPGTGKVEIEQTYPVILQEQGVVDRLLVKTGDTVKLGQQLLSLSGKPLYAIEGNSPLYRQLASGNSGDDVRWLQQSLNKMGYSTTIDGDYGSGTISSLNDFQGDKGLTETTKVGPDTFQTFPLPLVVMDVAVSQGQSASPGTVALTLANPSDLQIVVDVNEIDMPKLKLGQAVDVTVDALPSVKLTGKVASISPGLVEGQSSSSGQNQGSSSSQSGVVTYPVTIQLTNGDPQLKAGMKVNADIIIAEKADVLTIPASAVRTRGDQKFVLIPNLNGQPQAAPVEVGITSDSVAEIVSGLQEGQQVVVGSGTLSSASAARSGSPFGGPVMMRPQGTQGGSGFRGSNSSSSGMRQGFGGGSRD